MRSVLLFFPHFFFSLHGVSRRITSFEFLMISNLIAKGKDNLYVCISYVFPNDVVLFPPSGSAKFATSPAVLLLKRTLFPYLLNLGELVTSLIYRTQNSYIRERLQTTSIWLARGTFVPTLTCSPEAAAL